MKTCGKNLAWICLIAMLLVVLAPWFMPKMCSEATLENMSVYGTWLQGALTPIAILFAALSFLQQSRSTDHSSKIAARALFMQSLPALTGHLNYLCAASLNASYISATGLAMGDGLSDMMTFLQTFGPLPPNAPFKDVTKGNIVGSDPFTALHRDINALFQMAGDAGYGMLIDQRIRTIKDLIRNFK